MLLVKLAILKNAILLITSIDPWEPILKSVKKAKHIQSRVRRRMQKQTCIVYKPSAIKESIPDDQ